MYISSLTIRNYRNFKSSKIEFKDGINTIIGENGSGKTNLFRALRILIDDSLSRNYRLYPNDFNRAIKNWKGQWIIISLEFLNLDSSEEVQTIAIQGAGQMQTTDRGSYYFYFRPKHEFRKKLYEYSQKPEKSNEGLNKILDTITINDYESFFRGRGVGDFSIDDVYAKHVGDFENIIFPNPDNEDQLVIGSWLPREVRMENEISCTFIKALRDVENDLKSFSRSPLISLLRGKESTVGEESSSEITKSIDELNEKIGGLKEIKDLEKGVDNSIKQAVGSTYAPNIELRSELPNELDKLFQSLKLWVGDPDEEGHKGRLWELSLGGANLIYLSLKLLEYERVKNNKAANFLLIEEPEAHIHTHIQKTLFDNLHKGKTQIIVSTHSTHISSVSKIRSINILSRSHKETNIFNPTKGLNKDEALRIERYLDAVRSDLIFAKGVILVEGDAEQILIPKIFKESFGISLDEIGLSIVNIGSTGFKNIARLFHQDRIARKCSILTDLDTSISVLPLDPEDDTKTEKTRRGSQKIGIARKTILDEFIDGNSLIKAFYAKHTFEVSFIEAGNLEEVKKCVDEVYSQVAKRKEVGDQLEGAGVDLYGEGVLRLANKYGKGWFAILLSENISYSSVIPDYILQAIAHSTQKISISVLKDLALFRLKQMVADASCARPEKANALIEIFLGDEIDNDEFIELYAGEFPDDKFNKPIIILMIFDKLTKEQLAVVESQGNVLLTACPGSGKTRVIINKIAYEISTLDVNSKRKILALTFTNRASDEITRRLNRLGALSPKIWSGTIHSFCLEWIIKPYGCYLEELKNGFTIADQTYLNQRVNELRELHSINEFDDIDMKINRLGEYSSKIDDHVGFLDSYYEGLKKIKQIDFELLLHYSNKLLTTYPRIAKTLSKIFKYILVDEFQDTQDIQYSIISHIIRNSENKSNVLFVGDTDQAIYNSLGGVAKSFSELKNEISDEDLKSMSLAGNYRSAQRIINFYRNFQTNDIDIRSHVNILDSDTLISYNNKIDKSDIPEEIARLIKISLSKGVIESEICVLVPQWWLITSITKKLKSLLPELSFDASGITPMSKIRNNFWYKLGRLFLSEPSPKMYSKRYKWAEEVLDLFKVQTNRELINEESPEKKLLKSINEIGSKEEEGIAYLEECFTMLMKSYNISISEHSIILEEWESYFESIKNRLKESDYDVPSDTNSFKSFYHENNGIVINTCAGVKGEEFETVISYGLLYGYIPHWNDVFNGDPEIASKNLLYVICSRAKRNLHLISETGRKTKKGSKLTPNYDLNKILFDYDEV